jgi:hypothetical protein
MLAGGFGLDTILFEPLQALRNLCFQSFCPHWNWHWHWNIFFRLMSHLITNVIFDAVINAMLVHLLFFGRPNNPNAEEKKRTSPKTMAKIGKITTLINSIMAA